MTPDQLAAIRERDRDDREWLTGRIWHSPTTKAAVEDRAALLVEVDRLHKMVRAYPRPGWVAGGGT